MGHKESKIFEKVEEAIANQNETNNKSLDKKVLQLWKSLDTKAQGHLDEEQAKEFFAKVYDYCKVLLKNEGLVFDPNLTKEELIESWIGSFDVEKKGKITYEGFCLALKAVASACHKDLRDREEKEASHDGKAVVVEGANTVALPQSKAITDMLKAEHELMAEINTKDTKHKDKEKEKKKEKEPEVTTPSTLRRVFAQNQNPILTQTYEFQFFTPREIDHNVTAPLTGKSPPENVLSRVRSCIPLEYSTLGLNVILDGIPGAGLSTIMEKFCSTKETKNDDHPLSWAECSRDLFNIGTYIPIKIYKYSPRDKPTDPYIKFSSGLLVKIDLWIFVLDITKKLNDDLHHLIQARLKLVQEFSKQRKLNPALLFIGCKLDEREIREFSYADGRHLAEKHGAMYTEMSGATGLFVVRGLNNALRAAIGNREQRLLFANVAMS